MLWIENLQRLVALIDDKLKAIDAEVGPYSHANHSAWYQRHDQAVSAFTAELAENERAIFGARPAADYSVRMSGIRSSSTASVSGALRNWQVSARKKIATGGAS